ncbi:MAG: phage terminase large subunit [Alphaproteobacteria bacterium]|nr:phage terminase large subunit [Alphaproteobacteria bacterium]
MRNTPSERQVRVKFDAASRVHFSLFLRRVLATVDPAARYAHNWHMDAIAEYLAACAAGQVTRLIINLPPRMLKSTMVSVAWPAWLLGHQPSQRIMAACYAQSLSLKHSTDCRVVMQAPWYRKLFAHTRLTNDQNEKEKFTTTQRGYRRAVSVGGAAIGEGGNILIIDDPLNPLQASHHHQRVAVNQWFDHTWATRLDDKQHGVMLLVMQRLHPEDLSGYLLEKGGWEHLSLPAIAPEKTTIQIGSFRHTRARGDVLHVAREPLPVLERLKMDLGSANFNAQYQQMPVAQAGGLVHAHWLARVAPTVVLEGERYVQSWDTGVKAGAANDPSACATFALRDGVHVLVDMLVVRLEYPELKRAMVHHAARYCPEAILIEDKASGQSLLQDIRRETDLPVIACLPNADKVTRLLRVTPLMEAGKLALPTYAPWLAAFEQELFQFPDGAHDDQVDALSQYLNWVRSRKGGETLRVRRL